MTSPLSGTKVENQVPFVIEHGQADVVSGGYFTPVARLIVQPALRTSGLLAALPDREVKSLLLLLTYLTPNGGISPTTAQIAGALRLPECVVRSRMGKLTSFRWQGEQIVRHAFTQSGLDGYRISRSVVAEREAPKLLTETASSLSSPGRTYSGRDAVIAHSRAAYGRPRSEVEEAVARQLGIVGQPAIAPMSPKEADVRRRLIELGVSPIQADRLVAEHPVSVIRDQLTWLPDRAARSPARYIVRAIDERYDPPPRIRLERAIAAAEEEEQAETDRHAGQRTDETDRHRDAA